MADSTPRLAGEADLPRLREIVGATYARYLDRMDRPPFPMLADLRSRVLGQQRPVTRRELPRCAMPSTRPFWPFVLATTSVGQEGLHLHSYCHVCVHWNLPANPVDLEQREGRIHRYKGHAVRKNVASELQAAAFCDGRDPWQAVFDAAVAGRGIAVNDLVPYWVFPGAHQIERVVPVLPLSRETVQVAGRGHHNPRRAFGPTAMTGVPAGRQVPIRSLTGERCPRGMAACLATTRVRSTPLCWR